MDDKNESDQHWDTVYEARDAKVLPDDDPIGQAALAHFGSIAGTRLLDLGCGTGEYSRFFAARGAHVVAVDRSEVAITRMREEVTASGVTNIEPVVADAMDLRRLGPFDLAFGSMILHHIEPFSRFVDVLAGSLTPTGRAFFYENSSMSRALVWARDHLVGRFGIPKRSDEDEFPLEPGEIDLLRERFDVEVEHPRLLLVQLASGYLLHDHGHAPLDWVDQQLARVPRIRKLSYHQHLRLVARRVPVPGATARLTATGGTASPAAPR